MARKANSNVTGTKCSVCLHPEMKAINSAIWNREQCRAIAAQFGVDKSTVSTHARKCLGKAINQIHEERQRKGAIDVETEFKENLAFAKRLRTAAEEYLSHPDDPLKLAILPRADEIDVVYFDYNDFGKRGPKKKTAKLSMLLATIRDETPFKPDKVTIKHVDIRKFALDAIETADTCIDKFARLGGLYRDNRPNEETLEKALRAFSLWQSKNPHASPEDAADAIKQFAKGYGVPEQMLTEKAGIITVPGIQ